MSETTFNPTWLRSPRWLLGLWQSEHSGAWLRFLIAVAGLTLAFAAAIFSTATRESGNVLATVVLSSLALVISVAVGIGTVPYLARRLAAKRVREALDFEVTRAGALYVVVVLVVGVAALNTGNNLLYIIVSAMLAAIAVSGAASAVCLRGLRLDLKVPEHIFAGVETAGTLVVRNPRRWLPSFSITASPAEILKAKKSWHWVKTTFPVPPWRPPDRQWLQLPDRKLRRVAVESSGVFHQSAYFPFLPPKMALTAEVKLNFRKRGRYQEKFTLSTRFPFAFLVKSRRAALAREVLIYPELTNTEEIVELLPILSGKIEAYLKGRSADLYRIREYQPEDSVRHVDWKATAKSGALKVREYSREDERRLRFVFDNPSPGQITAQNYERMVSMAASAACNLEKQSVFLSFVSQDYESIGDTYGFLERLATIQPQSGPSLLETLPASTAYSLVFTAQRRGTIPAAVWASAYFVFVQ